MICCAAPVEANAETQHWSVYAFGLKVGNMRLSATEAEQRYRASGSFRTTGLAGVLRRIRFNVSSHGKVESGQYRPQAYDGFINTGKRISETSLDFSGKVPLVSGAQTPAVPIEDAAKVGAQDPMTVMWQVLQRQSETQLCALDQTQFDGTRLVRVTLTQRSQSGADVVCSGTYDRIGGYSAEELAEMKTSPLSVTYRKTDEGWQAYRLKLQSRHGTARLALQD